jgi:hypothetical protein
MIQQLESASSEPFTRARLMQDDAKISTKLSQFRRFTQQQTIENENTRGNFKNEM